MFDSSGFGNNGSITAVTLGVPGFSGAPGDYAYGFDGSTSSVTVPKSSSLNPGASDISITVHVNTTVRPGIGSLDFDLVRKGSAYKAEIYPKKGVAKANCVFKGSLGNIALKAGPDLVDGAWHTITCQKTPTAVTVIVDGVPYTAAVTIGDINVNSQPVAIGWQTGGADFYNGSMDDVSIVIG